MLEWIRRRFEQHRNAPKEVRRSYDFLELATADFEDLGEELGGWNTTEASRLYKRLVRGGFLLQLL